MKKVLMLASVASMIGQFNLPNIKLLQELSYEVHVACNFESGNTCNKDEIDKLKKTLEELNVKCYQVDFSRKVSQLRQNILAYKQVLKLVRTYNYEFIHCHSPIGGVVSRLVGRKTNVKVVYTAHGFHFYKGAPVFNWLIYYPIERFLSRYTEVLITINTEDYNRAKRFKAKEIRYVPGIGIDISNSEKADIIKDSKCKELGLPSNSTILLSVGELNKNKNHAIIIQMLSELKDMNLIYIICGQGSLKGYLEDLARKLGVIEQLRFLGYRNDINEIYSIADIFMFPSFREGLSASLMEAMSHGLPSIVSDIRGNRDLITNGINGLLVSPNSSKEFALAIKKILGNINTMKGMSEENRKIITKFSRDAVEEKMKEIYLLL